MEFFTPEIMDFFIRIMVAMFLGLILGIEREYAGKGAGMRTYALVAMGSALYVVVSEMVIAQYPNTVGLDPLRMAGQVIVGLGFIGAGTILFRDTRVTGLTTAAGIWVAGGIGIATGYALYSIAFFTTFATLFVFTVLWLFEKNLKKTFVSKNENEYES